MTNFIISAEAVCNEDKKFLMENNISLAPMKFLVNGVEFSSASADFSDEKICSFMREGATTRTTQINEIEAKDYLENLLKQGKDVLHLSFSSGQSGTCQNFVKASEELNKIYQNKVYVVDTLCQAGGVALLLKMLVKENFSNAKEAFDFLEKEKLSVAHFFTVEDLKYLVRGGRVSKTSAFMGKILQIKPILKLNDSGVIIPFKKVMGRKKSIIELFSLFNAHFNGKFNEVVISHADCLLDAQSLAKMIEKCTDVKVTILQLSSIITSHSGPGTLSVYFTVDKR